MTRTIVSTIPDIVDLCVYQGDDLTLAVLVNDTAGNPVDLTGRTPSAQIRPTPSSDTVLADFAASIDGNAVKLHLAAVDAAALPVLAYWDVQTVDPDGIVQTLAYGRVTAVREVTRP